MCYDIITMKHSKFLEIKESGLNPRIARRTWEEQRTRDEIALILKKMRKRKQKWKKISRSLEKREEELRRKKLELEILSISRSLERWYYEPTLYDLKFLDSLSYSDLSKLLFMLFIGQDIYHLKIYLEKIENTLFILNMYFYMKRLKIVHW